MSDSPQKKVKTEDTSALGQLRHVLVFISNFQFSTIVVDTGNISQISVHSPEDETTKPSLILAATNSRDLS
jgi:hypothetical protein